jgi:hypothetical protein
MRQMHVVDCFCSDALAGLHHAISCCSIMCDQQTVYNGQAQHLHFDE